MRKLVLDAFPWLVTVAVIGGAGYGWYAAASAPTRMEDGCLPGVQGRHRVIVLDSSDPVSPEQLDEIRALVIAIALEGGPDDRFSLFTLGTTGMVELLRVDSGCLDIPDLAGGKYAKLRTRIFLAAVEEFLATLEETGRPTSPLYEGVDTLLHRRDVFAADGPELWFISDLLQHSADGGSHYPGQPNYQPPEHGTDFFEGRAAPGRFKAVTLVYLQRPGARKLQSPAHQRLWMDVFKPFSDTPPVLEKL